MSNVNMKIKSQYRTFYLIVIVTFALSVTIYEIFAVEINFDLWIRSRSNVHMSIESQCRIFYLKVIVMFPLFVTICKILAVEICMTLTLIFRMGPSSVYIPIESQ